MTKSIRRLDGQGRVILPSHIRKALNLSTNSIVSVDMQDNTILIKSATMRCCICGAPAELVNYITIKKSGEEKFICEDCIKSIKEEA